jgi:DsbC/DsbD-like thiol-disulfide interchange protein
MHLLRTRWHFVPLALAVILGVRVDVESSPPGKKSDSVVKVSASPEQPDATGKQTIVIKVEIDKGWHIYANPVGYPDLAPNATTVKIKGKSNPRVVQIVYPKGKTAKDTIDTTEFEYKIYEGTVTIKATVQRAVNDKEPLEIAVTLNACKEKTCLMPGTAKVTVP